MKDEIKEIQRRIDKYKNIGLEPVYCEELITTGELQSVLDCITNLEKENEILNKGIEYAKRIEKDYKTRFDKAIEYHNNCIENLKLSKINDNEKLAYQVAYEIHKNYLNILQGSDKE